MGELTYSTLQAYARRQMGDKVGTKADTEIQQSINDALGMIAKERRWLWYLSPGTISTITVTNGSPTVTLSGGTFPTYAASGELSVAGQWFTISARGSGTSITLAVNYPGASGDYTAGGWLVYQDAYSLPTDCMNFHKPLYGKTAAWRPMPTSYENLLSYKSDTQVSQDGAACFCVRKNQILLAPAPNSIRVLNFCYYRRPAAVASANDEADWDNNQYDVLYRAIDYQLALRGPCVAGDSQRTLNTYKQAIALAAANEHQETERPSPLAALGMRSRDFNIPAS